MILSRGVASTKLGIFFKDLKLSFIIVALVGCLPLFMLSKHSLRYLASTSELGFDIRDCKGIYLDIGTNVGVQIRKVYDSHLFPGAPMIEEFKKSFDLAHAKGICSIGFEPNTKHTAYLKQLEDNLKCRGYKVRIFTETAVSVRDEDLTFYSDLKAKTDKHEWGASLINWQNNSESEAFKVRGLDLGKFLMIHVFKSLGDDLPSHVPIIMKVDIEGAEYDVVPHLIATGAFCNIDFVTVEWHTRIKNTQVGDYLNANVIKQFLNGLPSCKTKIIDLDDETFADGVSIPYEDCKAGIFRFP